MDLFLQVNSEECHAYVHLMDVEIVLGGDTESQPDVFQASSRCIQCLVVDAFDLVISSTDWPGLEPLHIACSSAKTKSPSLHLFSLLYPQTQNNEIEVSLKYAIA